MLPVRHWASGWIHTQSLVHPEKQALLNPQPRWDYWGSGGKSLALESSRAWRQWAVEASNISWVSITHLNSPAFGSRCYCLHCELCIVPEIEIWRKASSSRLQLHWGLISPGLPTKAIKASAIYTFPKQDCGIHFPSLEWDLHGDADITRLGEILSSACVMRFSLQEHPLAMK